MNRIISPRRLAAPVLGAALLVVVGYSQSRAAFSPPAFGSEPTGYVKASTTHFERTMGEVVDITWTSYVFEKDEQGTKTRHKRVHAWFRCKIPTVAGAQHSIPSEIIGAQARLQMVKLRIDPNYGKAVTLVETFKGQAPAPTVLGAGFVGIHWSHARGQPLPDEIRVDPIVSYQLNFEGTGGDLIFECYYSDYEPVDRADKQPDDGYPPPETPSNID